MICGFNKTGLFNFCLSDISKPHKYTQRIILFATKLGALVIQRMV